ncbi:hypothetical protein MAQ58_24740, partial [Enterobacter sp. DRP3]|nr:hypothetical protein [Enterobacter sp. DRP3]
MSDEALVERLVTLRGVGRWTVEMLLIYTLERMDILPVDDFGVREGYRRLKRLDKAPSPGAQRALQGVQPRRQRRAQRAPCVAVHTAWHG